MAANPRTKLIIYNTTDIGTGWSDITWSAPLYDDAGCWSSGTPKRLTVPSGYTKARVTLALTVGYYTVTSNWNIVILKNATGNPVAFSSKDIINGADQNWAYCTTGWISVSATDYFIAQAIQTHDTDIRGLSTGCGGTYFEIELA
jgi:hypothetical protein